MAYNLKEVIANKPSRFTEDIECVLDAELLLLQE